MDSLTNNSLKKGKKLVNFEVPIELLDRFDNVVNFILGTRTQVLLHLMEIFTVIFEDKQKEQVNKIKKAWIKEKSSLLNLLNPFTFSKMKPAAVLASIISWSQKYGVFIYFGCNRETSELLTYKILSMYQMNKQRGVIWWVIRAAPVRRCLIFLVIFL